MTLITLSAPYGAGGSHVGPAVAQRLGVPFLDRAIPTGVAERLAVPLREAIDRDESVGSWLTRALLSFGQVTPVLAGAAPAPEHVLTDDAFRQATEQGLRLEEVDRATAARHLEETDRARRAYIQHFYRCDARDPQHYHLVIDSTAIPLDACVELIAGAALARG